MEPCGTDFLCVSKMSCAEQAESEEQLEVHAEQMWPWAVGPIPGTPLVNIEHPENL